MATFTIDQYIAKLQSIKLDVEPFYNIANELIARIDKRVFDKGINGAGVSIRSYSKKGAYFSVSGKKNHARNLGTPARGKNNTKPTFKNGNRRKSVFFAGGYNAFKSDVGKNTAGGNVNMWLSGSFRRAWAGSIDPVTMAGNGFKIQFTIKTSTQNKQGKVTGLLKKYPKSFDLTKGERDYILKRFGEEFESQIIK